MTLCTCRFSYDLNYQQYITINIYLYIYQFLIHLVFIALTSCSVIVLILFNTMMLTNLDFPFEYTSC